MCFLVLCDLFTPTWSRMGGGGLLCIQLWDLIYIWKEFWGPRAKEGNPRASYNLGATGEDLLFGSFHTTSGLWKDKLAKLFVSLFAQEPMWVSGGLASLLGLGCSASLAADAGVSYSWFWLCHKEPASRQHADFPRPQLSSEKEMDMGCQDHSYLTLSCFFLCQRCKFGVFA